MCSKCKETLFESVASDKIEAEVKRRGLWGLRARSKVSKVGNALDVRIPKALAEFLSLKKGQEIILEPVDKTRLQIIVA
ncbi:AbrB/MazE/SpoVT family DNA-binding domain-containing protein [Candidatus Woesearchaeota archaeon]|nr:AbrB/MazE/SpoVT family DNA-binding domain-containing protein [Candidatus Woesearchaeota archaeon]